MTLLDILIQKQALDSSPRACCGPAAACGRCCGAWLKYGATHESFQVMLDTAALCACSPTTAGATQQSVFKSLVTRLYIGSSTKASLTVPRPAAKRQ